MESIASTNVNYIDATIDINAIYQYALKAVDSAGNESLFSNIELFNPINSDLSTNTASISARYDKTNNSVQLIIQTNTININVINGSINSVIDCFPRYDIDTAIREFKND